MRHFYTASLVTMVLCFVFAPAYGQETELTVIDEVIAQVNDDVITLSQVKREKQIVVDEFMRQGKTREEAEAEANENEGLLIANLITEEMMRQKGVEVGLDKAIEAEVNQRLLGLVKENNLKSINELYQVMESQGVDPEIVKKTWRSAIMKQQVLFQLVDLVVYWDTSDEELREYFNKNKEKFLAKEKVTLSEIFLPFGGKNEAEVEALAKSITERARNGEDFVKLAIQYSERPNVAETKGVVGEFETDKLNDDIQNAISGLKAGQIADPIKWDIGMEIVRVDALTPASTESNFDENNVRRAIMEEKAPAARAAFIERLREDSYVKIRENYRGIVTPFLTSAPAGDAVSTSN